MAVSFFLKKPDADNRSAIFAILYAEGKKIKFYTGRSIDPDRWNKRRQQPKSDTAEDIRLKDYLSRFGKVISQVYDELSYQGPADSKLLRKRVDQALNQDNDLLSVFDRFIQENSALRSEGWKKKYNNVRNQLRYFQDHLGHQLTFQALDQVIYNKLLTWFFSKKKYGKTEKGAYVNNTAGRAIKFIKTFLKWATENGYCNHTAWKQWKGFADHTDVIALELAELLHLYNLDLSDNDKLAKTRDLFCLCCFTGLRYSDLADLRPENIHEGYILKTTVKTRDKNLKIPVIDKAARILERYPGGLPVISNQKYNDYLKELARKAELNRLIRVIRYSGSTRKDETKPLHELITTHIARKTFATIHLQLGMNIPTVMAIGGWKDYKTMKPYVAVSDQSKMDEMKKVWE